MTMIGNDGRCVVVIIAAEIVLLDIGMPDLEAASGAILQGISKHAEQRIAAARG